MPRLLSRLPARHQKAAIKALLALLAICTMSAVLLFIEFSQTIETSGHLWWKESRAIPLAERRPYLLGGIALSVVSALSVIGLIELFAAQARRAEVEAPPDSSSQSSLPSLLIRHARKSARNRLARRAEALERERWEEMSTAEKAALAYERGDQFLSVELLADETLAWHLNQIYSAGWRYQSLSRRHVRHTKTTNFYRYSETMRESAEFRTYIFRRSA